MKTLVKNVSTPVVLSLAVVLQCFAAQAATTFNFEVDFSTSDNSDTSTWSYRYQADGSPDNLTRDGHYELLPNLVMDIGGIGGFNGWQAPGALPQVVKNTTGTEVRDAGHMIVPGGQSVVHPADGQIAVVSWLAPASGTVRLDFRFTDLDAGCGDGVSWFVDVEDSAGNVAGGSIANGGDSGLQTIPTLSVVAGARVNFIVDPATSPGGNYWCDSTRLFAEITYLGVYPDFNLERDFSLSQNSDTSVWSYRFQSNGTPNNLARDGNYELLPDQAMNMDRYSGLNGWYYIANPAYAGQPEVGKNMSGADIVSGGDPFRIPAGQCYMHPAPDQLVVVSWLAPSRGAVRVNFRFADLNDAAPDAGDTGVVWFVDKGDGAGNLAAGGVGPGGDSGPQTIQCVNVAAGDRINFLVDPFGPIFFDATRISAEISYLDDFDLERDFSTAVNSDSSVWSYRYQADGSPDNRSRDGSYELLPDAVTDLEGAAGLNGWAYVANPVWTPGNLPQVTKNTGVDMAGGVPAGQCDVHPAPSQIAVVSWLAPSNGLVRVEFQFTDLNAACGNGVLWFVDRGDAAGNLVGGGFPNGGDSGAQTLPSVAVAAGDRINFIVDPNGTAESDIYCDLTRVFARVTYVSYTDFDFERDFAGSVNTDSSVWSYRYQADGSPDNLARDGSYELLPESVANIQGIAGFNGWQASGGLPQVSKNTTGATVNDGHTMFVPAGQSQLHPNPNQIVVVSWLAPSNGTVRADFRFTDLNAGGGDGVRWYVDRGDASGNLASGDLANGGDSGPQVIARFEVLAGDRIHFIVDPKGPNHGWDSTRLMARMTYVTETDFDFERDFSTVQNNETTTWSYRYQAGSDTLLRDGNYALLPNQTTGSGTMTGMNGWYDAASSYQLPLVVRNLGNVKAWDGYTQWTPPGFSTVHPDDGQIVVVSWLAPSSGSVRVEFQFTDLNWGGGNGVAWYVDKGDAAGNLASGVFGNQSSTRPEALASVPVATGDRINFVVDPNGGLGWDATRVSARITYNPPPPGSRATASLVEDQDGKKLRITFDTQAGFQYTVEYTDVLPASGWTELFGSPVAGTGAPMWLDDPTPWDASSQRFYRVKVQ